MSDTDFINFGRGSLGIAVSGILRALGCAGAPFASDGAGRVTGWRLPGAGAGR